MKQSNIITKHISSTALKQNKISDLINPKYKFKKQNNKLRNYTTSLYTVQMH